MRCSSSHSPARPRRSTAPRRGEVVHNEVVTVYTHRVAQINPKLERDEPLRQPRLLAAAFVLYGLAATAFLAINMPPFQNPDEPNHFLRAAQLADGGLVGTRF